MNENLMIIFKERERLKEVGYMFFVLQAISPAVDFQQQKVFSSGEKSVMKALKLKTGYC